MLPLDINLIVYLCDVCCKQFLMVLSFFALRSGQDILERNILLNVNIIFDIRLLIKYELCVDECYLFFIFVLKKRNCSHSLEVYDKQFLCENAAWMLYYFL